MLVAAACCYLIVVVVAAAGVEEKSHWYCSRLSVAVVQLQMLVEEWFLVA